MDTTNKQYLLMFSFSLCLLTKRNINSCHPLLILSNYYMETGVISNCSAKPSLQNPLASQFRAIMIQLNRDFCQILYSRLALRDFRGSG